MSENIRIWYVGFLDPNTGSRHGFLVTMSASEAIRREASLVTRFPDGDVIVHAGDIYTPDEFDEDLAELLGD